MSPTTGKRSDVQPSHYTPSEVASLFQVNTKTVTRWADSGWLPSIRTLGGHRRFPCEEVDRILREGLPAEAFDDHDVEDERSPVAAATHASKDGAAPGPIPGPGTGTADASTTARHPINTLIEDHFGGDAVAALLELAGRYGIAVAYLDRPWFTRHLGRALAADEWNRVAAELNDFCAVLDDLCAEDLEVYADLVLHAAGIAGVTAPADLIGDYEAALIAAGIAWTDNTAPAAQPGQRANTTDTATAVLDAPAISTEPTPGSEPAPGAEHATPDAGGPLPIPPPSPGREEPVGSQHPAARSACDTIDPHQLALSPAADSGQQAPSTATTAERTPAEPQPAPQPAPYLPKPSPNRAEPAELEMSVEALRERYSAGESVPSIARRMGLTPRQVYRWMRHERINRRPPGGRTWDTFPIELQELREWYEAGETIRGLAKALDVSPTTVKMRLAESGATTRPRESGSKRLELPVPPPVLRKRYEAGESLYDLAEELAVAIGTIRHRLLEAGTKMRPVGGPARSQATELPVPVEQVLQRVEAGEPLHSLARELGVPRNTLRGQLEAAAKYDPPPQPSQPNEKDLTLEGHAR